METILIIGAGAAGLMAARELSKAGYPVVVLEGAPRTGGRVHTIDAPGFERPVELGAEFIHGHLPLSFALLEEAGLHAVPVSGRMVRVNSGHWEEQSDFTIDWDLLMQKLHELKEDMTMAAFLQAYFPGAQYAQLRRSVQRFTEGFDVADTGRVSALALREEWSHEEEEQYRISGGYRQITDYLERQAVARGAVIHTSCIVKEVRWQQGRAEAVCADGQTFAGHRIIITVPISILHAGSDQPAGMVFTPAIGAYIQAAGHIGYGSVVKVLLQFREPFWQAYSKNIGFIISEEPIGTWWTQPEKGSSLLTGWAGGPAAVALQGLDNAGIAGRALDSLANIFRKPVKELEALLAGAQAADWGRDPFSLGAYSYDTVETAAARRLLSTPIENTVFFAGEALYEGASPGTVEAALTSGKAVAQAVF